MDDFFRKTRCDRCGASLAKGRIMSMFDTSCICIDCKRKEEKLPEYNAAVKSVREAESQGERNFKGIGYPGKG